MSVVFCLDSVCIEGRMGIDYVSLNLLINAIRSCLFSERSMRIALCQVIRICRFFRQGVDRILKKHYNIKELAEIWSPDYARDVGNLMYKNLVER